MKNHLEKRVAREANRMTKQVVVEKIKSRVLTMQQGADILGITVRHLRRLRRGYEREGPSALEDKRAGAERSKRIGLAEAARICRLKAEAYADFSVRHFYEFAMEQHGVKASYSYVLGLLQRQGLVTKAQRRGTYRRRRARQPMVGMRLHLDSSTHPWLGQDRPSWDLTVVVDDADGRILSARFAPEEGTMTTLQALWEVLTSCGRFCELYTDRGGHFCQTSDKEVGPNPQQNTEVARVLGALNIRHIWARSPQARGRSERVFGTIQGRLPQELRKAGIRDYAAANRYLQEVFVPDYNRRFTVEPAQPGSAFCALPALDLQLLLSIQHQRTVRLDSTVRFQNRLLQLPPRRGGPLYKKSVTVHTFLDGTLGLSYHGQLLACFDAEGQPLQIAMRPSPAQPKPTRMDPTPAEPLQRPRHSDLSDPNFWAFLNPHPSDTTPVAHRGDLYVESR